MRPLCQVQGAVGVRATDTAEGLAGLSLQQQPWRVATTEQYSKERRPRQWTASPTSTQDSGDTLELDWHVVTAPRQQQQPPPLPTAEDLLTSPMLMTGSLARASVFDQFLRYYLPDGPRLYAHHSSGSWLATARSNRQGFPPLEAAACALGVLTLGRGTKDLAMQRRSFYLYGDALGFARRLVAQTRLDDKNWLRVLETVNLLSLFEALAPQYEQQRTLAHIVGLSALIKLAGPYAFQEPDAHNVFLHARSAIVYTAVLQEKSTYLAEPKWISEPWAVVPKTPIGLCLDIVTMLPALLELTNTIADAVKSYQDCTHLLLEFDTLSAQMRSHLDETSELFVRTPPEESNGNVHDFSAVQLYHCCELFRHDAVRRLSRHADDLPLIFARYVDEANRSLLEMEMLARTIINDINDFNTDECGFLTSNMLFLPTLAANQFLKRNNSDDEEVVAACRKTARTFIERGFYFFSNFV